MKNAPQTTPEVPVDPSATAPAAAMQPTGPVAMLAALREAQARADAAERAAADCVQAAERRLNDAAAARQAARDALQQAMAHGWSAGELHAQREAAEAGEREARAAGEALGAARRALEAARAENAAAVAALSDYVPQVTAEQVHEAVAECLRLRAEIERYEALAAGIVEPTRVDGALQAAHAERRCLLGDAAEGKGDPKALAAAEARVSALEAQAAEAAHQAATAADTRAALRERAEATAAQLRAAEHQTQDLRRLFWLSVQVAAFGDYLAAALAARDAWLRAEAADRQARVNGLKSLAGFGWDDLMLPSVSAPVGDGRPVVKSTLFLRSEVDRACNDLHDALG